MMTNKPMLSVERDLLERWEESLRTPAGRQELLEGLRALLDKQSCGACGGCDNGCKLDRESPPVEPAVQQQGDHDVRPRNIGGDQSCAVGINPHFAYADKWRSKKHQCEPVAWTVRRPDGTIDPGYSTCFADEADSWPDTLVDGYVVSPLYAEKPAPVAVVMPARELYTKYLAGAIPNNANEVGAYKDGWNACLDEYSRLNGVKL